MTEYYVHLAPQNLVDTVSSIEDRPHFDSIADNNQQAQGDTNSRVIDLMDEKWWARKDSNWLISY
jgi:hypothetical protein